MPRQTKIELIDRVVQAIYESNWNILYAGNITDHPVLLKIYNGQESYSLRIYIWNLTHGGGQRSANEYRIQITGVSQFEKRAREKTLILGWWEKIGVFAGFDFYKHKSILGQSPSIQIKEETLRKATINGFSTANKRNDEIAIAFRPDFFMDYVRNLENLHQIRESEDAIDIIERVAEGKLEINSKEVKSLNFERRSTIITISRKSREKDFSKGVLSAYRNQCAFSGIQLNLVEAAHIYPVSEPSSTDDTSNGIALSTLYHRAFDRGLVTVNEQYEIIINDSKISRLAEVGFGGGANKFKPHLRSKIVIPFAIIDRPNINFIRDANKLRV